MGSTGLEPYIDALNAFLAYLSDPESDLATINIIEEFYGVTWGVMSDE
jgi:hypothetical protein